MCTNGEVDTTITELAARIGATVLLLAAGCAHTPDPGGWSEPVFLAWSEEPTAAEEERQRRTGASHVPTTDAEGDFHFTAIRNWFFLSFVPDKSDPLTYGLETNSAWEWGNVAATNISYIELADFPQPVPGMPSGNPEGEGQGGTGLTDLLTAFLFSDKGADHGPHHFALGFAAQLPTATDDALGSGKWSLGPAVEYEYHSGEFFAAFVALNLFSVAGDPDRKDVNMLMIKPMVTYEFVEDWKAVYMPYGISVYWNKPTDEAVYLPIGGGLQRDFKIGEQEMAFSLQYFYYVVRPDSGTQHDLRFMLEFDF